MGFGLTSSFRGTDTGHCFTWIIAIIILIFFFTDLDDCFKTTV